MLRTLLRSWHQIPALNRLRSCCRGVGKSSTVAMYGATKLYAILAMRVRPPTCLLHVARPKLATQACVTSSAQLPHGTLALSAWRLVDSTTA